MSHVFIILTTFISDLIFTTHLSSHESFVSIGCIFTELDHPLHFCHVFYLLNGGALILLVFNIFNLFIKTVVGD